MSDAADLSPGERLVLAWERSPAAYGVSPEARTDRHALRVWRGSPPDTTPPGGIPPAAAPGDEA